MEKYKVLVADSTASLRHFIKYSLEDYYNDIAIESASNGKNIQHRIEQTYYDLIIYDREMPLLSGEELLAWIRGHQALKHIPVIMMSTNSQEVTLRKAIELGANAYIIKPFKVDALISKVAEVLGKGNKNTNDRRTHSRRQADGKMRMKFGEHESTGSIIDISRGGVLGRFEAKPPYPHVLDNVLISVRLQDGPDVQDVEGSIVRIDAANTMSGTTHIVFAVNFNVELSAEIEKSLLSHLPAISFP